VPAMAAVTSHLGFGITANLSFEPAFLFARRMSSLDHLTGGRVGWNIVTGYLDSAARAAGLDAQAQHGDRYDLAEEYAGLCYRLWEESWAGDAVRADRAAGVYAEPSRVRAILHRGELLRMEGIHLCAPSPQRTPVLFQAGASERGMAFAARHAECVFLNGGPPERVAPQVAALRAQAGGRRLRIFVGASLVVGRTRSEADALLEEYRRHASVEGALAHASASLGVDFGRLGMDEPIEGAGNAITSNLAALRGPDGIATKRRLVDQFVLGARQRPWVGEAGEVAARLVAYAEQTGCDGFNLARTVVPECLEAVVELVVPVLQERGAYKAAYAPGSFREKLFGAGPLLPPPHPAAAVRR